MATEIFDASAYVRAPIVNVSNGITLGHALAARARSRRARAGASGVHCGLCSKIVGLVDPEDPATIKLVRDALRPIDAHREAVAKRAAEGKAAEPAAEGDVPAQDGTDESKPPA